MSTAPSAPVDFKRGNKNGLCSRQGWVLLEQTCEFAEIQSTKHFIKLVLVETNQMFSGNSNAILTRQTRAHQQFCVKQTPSARILFFSTNMVYVLNIEM